ncbi:hypothetical protein [Shimia sagamensis]|uniref:Uncharacterized protein n=1 Tax=Shimia sagamensis TaxID=1566352 RepID=A0ABY1NXI3_9RHOB|nr:hypothetical protein [Shimia sagamensis]SMP20267.1 hypothetical protein SAMN06265373_103503 [Shimia sagamensis]
MPVTFEVIPALSLVHYVYSGNITVDDPQINSYDHPLYHFDMAEVADVSRVSGYDIGFGEMRNFITRSREQQTKVMRETPLLVVGTPHQMQAGIDLYSGLASAISVPYVLQQVAGYPEVLALLDLPSESIGLFPEDCQTEAHLLTHLSS